MDNANKKVAIVTGATGAIGKAIATKLAEDNSLEVVLVARNKAKVKKVVDDIISKTGNNSTRSEIADLALHSSVKELAARWKGPLHILINNAGISPPNRIETPEGIELQFATNVLGYFWMIEEMTKFLKDASPSRIVNVASQYAGELDLYDPEFKHKKYDNNTSYRQSKQANRMLTVAFAEKLKEFNITVNACHPGVVNSKLSNDLGFGGHETPEQGAKTPVWLATSNETEGITGCFFDNKQEVKDHFATDQEKIKMLFELCAAYK